MWNGKIERQVNGKTISFYVSCNPTIAQYQKNPVNIEQLRVVDSDTTMVLTEKELTSKMYKLKRSITKLEAICNRTAAQSKQLDDSKRELEAVKKSYWSK